MICPTPVITVQVESVPKIAHATTIVARSACYDAPNFQTRVRLVVKGPHGRAMIGTGRGAAAVTYPKPLCQGNTGVRVPITARATTPDPRFALNQTTFLVKCVTVVEIR